MCSSGKGEKERKKKGELRQSVEKVFTPTLIGNTGIAAVA